MKKKNHKKKSIAIVFGTRPEIIKFSPIIRLLKKKKVPFFVIHTGQHYSYEMDRLFIQQLELPTPKHTLFVRSLGFERHGDHTGRTMLPIEEVLLRERPSIVLVEGDTNTVLAASLVASKMSGMALGHVEAGLRSYDRQMPEELNRILSDHASDFLFAPTPSARKILLGEGISSKKIFMTGNTIVDAVQQNLVLARRKVRLESLLPKNTKDFFLLTLHRQENVDHKKALTSIVEGLARVIKHFKIPIVFPAHPRTVKLMKSFRLKLPEGLHLLPAVGFLEFLRLEEKAKLILTDSGGVQEEACILRVPCVTLRTTTERPETVTVGANIVAGHNPAHILKCAKKMIQKRRTWKNPFGDGRAAQRILKAIS